MSDQPAKRPLNDVNLSQLTVNQRQQYAGDFLSEWQSEFQQQPFLPQPIDKVKEAKYLQMEQAMNSLLTRNNGIDNPYLMRAMWMQSTIDPRRNLDCECGYPTVIMPRQYRYMYDREGIAQRVNDIYPDECWAVDPKPFDGNNPIKRESPFEKSYDALCDSEVNPEHYMHRGDVLSGVGRFGALLLGVNDDQDMSVPLPHLDQYGQINTDPKLKPLKLLYMRPFDEILCQIVQTETDTFNPRFGQPLYYHIMFSDFRMGESLGNFTSAMVSFSKIVHWTRVLHLADNREISEIYGRPRMQTVFNRLCDIRKILGGSAEMFWKGGFPGYSFEMDPSLITSGAAIDKDRIEQELEEYSNGLRRYLSLVGMSAKSLAPQVADPKGNFTAQLEATAISIGVPLRIFTGSEQAQLASGQDVRTWNRRLSRRQNRYLTPYVVRPFIERMRAFRIMQEPINNRYGIHWPDINLPSEDDRSKTADKVMSALQKYMLSGAWQVIPPEEFWITVMGMNQDQAMEIVKAAKKGPGYTIKTPAVMQAEVKPDPPTGGFGA